MSAGLPDAVRCATTDLLWFLRRKNVRESTGALLAGAFAARMATVFRPVVPGTVATVAKATSWIGAAPLT